MAKPKKSGGGGGGGGDKRPPLQVGRLGDLMEVGLGFLAGQISSGLVGASIAAGIRSLGGTLFERIYGGKRNQADSVKDDDITKAKKEYRELIQKQTGDDKLAEMAQRWMSRCITIEQSTRVARAKDEAIEKETLKYERDVYSHLLSLSRRGLGETLAKLSPDEDRAFMDWLTMQLDQERRDYILIQKDHINSPAMILGMLAYSNDPVRRFEYLKALLPKLKPGEQFGSLFDAAFEGRWKDHPMVKGGERWMKGIAAERDAARAEEDKNWIQRSKLLRR